MAKFSIKDAMGQRGTLLTHIDFDNLTLLESTASKAVYVDLLGANITFKGTGFKFTDGDATGGTVTDVEFRNTSGALVLDVDNASIALKKVAGADYFAMLKALQSGNDTLIGTDLGDNLLTAPNAGNDKVLGGEGSDLILGSAGNNKYDGGEGQDILNYAVAYIDGKTGIKLDAAKGTVENAWRGTDTITNIEVFFGTYEKDVMKGSKRDEVFGGEAGDDRITGGKGDDRFHFNEFDGEDTITDFGNGDDLIHIRYTNVDEFSDLNIAYKKGNAFIEFDQFTSITLLDVAANSLKSQDFDFSME